MRVMERQTQNGRSLYGWATVRAGIIGFVLGVLVTLFARNTSEIHRRTSESKARLWSCPLVRTRERREVEKAYEELYGRLQEWPPTRALREDPTLYDGVYPRPREKRPLTTPPIPR